MTRAFRSMKPYSVLVSDASSYKAVVLCRHLRLYYPRLRILTCDHRPITRWLHTRYSDDHHILPASPGELHYVYALADLVQSEEVNLLLPINSTEMGPLLHHRECFGNALDYWGSAETYDLLNAKDRLYGLCCLLNIPMPERYMSSDEAEYPVVVKPTISASSRGVRYCADAATLQGMLARGQSSDQLLIQRYVRGQGAGYSVFASNGRVMAGSGHLRLAELPVRGGSSTYRESLHDAGMSRIAAQIIAETGWSGFAMFEFKLAPKPVLIEVNPRIWGSIHQALCGDAKMLEPLFGNARTMRSARLRTFFSPLVHASMLGYLLRGNPQPLADFIAHYPMNRADIPLLRDPAAWLGSLARLG